jgi:pimeloyl-ACP methyl ester carboxylesterase
MKGPEKYVQPDTTNCSADLAPRAGSVHVERTRITYLEWGESGVPLLLLHGITSSARTWWRVAPALVSAGYHVYALDMPGHGESDETDDHRIDSIAALVGAAARHVIHEPFVLIGHSWGGATALAVTSNSEMSALLNRVVLVDPSLRMSPVWGAERAPGFLVGVGQPPEETLPMVRSNNPGWHECDVAWKGVALQQCRAAVVRGFFTQSGDWDLTARLGHVNIPLLVLVAEQTVIAPEVLSLAEQTLRPNLGELRRIPGTDHNMLRGGYDVVMPILIDWLRA